MGDDRDERQMSAELSSLVQRIRSHLDEIERFAIRLAEQENEE